jgi:hypothetical protein
MSFIYPVTKHLQLLSVLLSALLMFQACGDTEEEKDQPPSLQHSARDIKVVDEIHTNLLATLPEYESKNITGLTLSQIQELHTYMNIQRWNSGGDISRRGGSDYEEAAEILQIPVSKIQGADTYYDSDLQPKLLELTKELYKNNPDITLDPYSPLVASAYCGINTIQASIVIYGKKDQQEMEAEALQKAEKFMEDLPAWVTGFKLFNSTYKDTVLETHGEIGCGFLWKKGESIQKRKEGSTGYGYRNPAENDFWCNNEWNNRKMIPHPAYTFLNPQN